MRHIHLLLLVLAVTTTPARADNWPSWHGPQNNAVSAERNLPETWSPTDNVRWKVPLPEACNSTPIVWEKQVFITQGLDQGKRRAVIALDRSTGKMLWQREVVCNVEETSNRHNPPCSSSPVTDGEAVYAYFASAGVAAYDLAGRPLWHRDLGPVSHKWGNGASPVLYKDLLIVFHGPGDVAVMTALDKKTGQTVWSQHETAINSNIFGSWSTPVIVRVKDHDELLMPLPGERVGGDGELKAYDPVTGSVLWRCVGLGNEIYATPVVSQGGDLVVAISGHNGPTMAVRPGGQGDVTSTHRLWRTTGKMPQRVGTGILHQGRLYLADAPGIAECVDAATGKVLWEKRLGGDLWGSMLLADGKLYVTNLEGETFVLAAGDEFQLLAKNTLDERMYAALAVSDGDLFLRTYEHLWCISTGK